MSDIQTSEEETEITEPVTPQDDQEQETPEAPTIEETPQGDPAPETNPQPQPTPEGYVPKEKFVASARESILNAERVKVSQSRIEELIKVDTPTDEAMRQLYPEWDTLDAYNKKVLIRQETTAMQQARIIAKQQDIDARQQVEDEIESLLDNPKYSKLLSKQAEFKRFAMRKENRGISAEVLARAFLFDGDDETPANPNPTPAQPKNPGLERGSGGPREAPKPKKISLEEAGNLRKTNYKEYMRLLKAGMIEDI